MTTATRAPLADDLTILLTLKDRVAYTLRWMEYANAAAIPCKVLIADGGLEDSAQIALLDKGRYPNVDYDYVRFPPDRAYADYYRKMADAMAMVRTPFVAMADNDDFFIMDTLRQSVDFLKANADYIACGGQGAIFWMSEGSGTNPSNALYGGNVQWKCTREASSIEANSARERLRAVSVSKSDTFYYDVKRIDQARRESRIVSELDLKDLFLVEHLIWHLGAVAGKTKRLGALYLARQQDSPGSSGGSHQASHGDWIGRMLVESWSADFGKFLEVVARQLAQADAIPAERARESVIASYRASIAPSILSDVLSEPTVRMPTSIIVPAVRKLVGLPEGNLVRRVARALYRRWKWVSLDAVYGTEWVTTPVHGAKRDLGPILEFLAGAEVKTPLRRGRT